jgi:protein-disulfide isomerase
MSPLRVPVGSADHVQGNPRAAVTLVEYGDYECPYCGAAYPVLKEVQRRMGDELRFVFRNFPLAEVHPHALVAAEAAEAAGAQGQFWQMHDTLYEHQDALGLAHLKAFAKGLKLDEARFAQDLEAHTFLPRIQADFREGVRSGVNGTPTLFVNGTRYDGPLDLEGLLTVLRAAARP